MTSSNHEKPGDNPVNPPPTPKLPDGYKPTKTVVSYRGSGPPLWRRSEKRKPKG